MSLQEKCTLIGLAHAKPMSQATVNEILDRIEQLPAEDRLLLEELLAAREEAKWDHEAARARQNARERGLDQKAIDRAVQAARHDDCGG